MPGKVLAGARPVQPDVGCRSGDGRDALAEVRHGRAEDPEERERAVVARDGLPSFTDDFLRKSVKVDRNGGNRGTGVQVLRFDPLHLPTHPLTGVRLPSLGRATEFVGERLTEFFCGVAYNGRLYTGLWGAHSGNPETGPSVVACGTPDSVTREVLAESSQRLVSGIGGRVHDQYELSV